MKREGERGDKRVGGNRMRRRGWERVGVVTANVSKYDIVKNTGC